MSVDGSDDIEEAGYDDELGSVVGGSYLDGGCAEIEEAGKDVEQTVAEVSGEVEDVEQVSGVRGVDFALEREADDEHREDGNHEQAAANPLAQHEMACAGYEPAGDENHRGER